MKLPEIGIIHDGGPNAFSYGHTPNNMRIVITEGLIGLLEPKELESVVAHDIGHGKHWDMALMTLAQLVPLVAYYIYRTLIRMRSSGREDKTAAGRIGIAVGAYIVYVVSEYIVLWFSRTREYHADRFAGEVTRDPAALAAALVKIAYGMSARTPADQGGESGGSSKRGGRGMGDESKSAAKMDSIGALGIFSPAGARGLVAAAAGTGGTEAGHVGRESLKSAMQWDLWNPWAKWYEMHSTHPLVANRLQCLAEQSAMMGQEPYVVFDRKQPESYWDEFFVDLFVKFLPLIAAAGTFAGLFFAAGAHIDVVTPAMGGWTLFAFGVGSIINLMFSYRAGFFPPMAIASLLHNVKVSDVRPIPVSLKGKLIGRGVPGLIWSEDFVMQDATGILFLDYRQPLSIWQWLFGLMRAGGMAGKNVEVTGWFRRAPVPYLEINEFLVDGTRRTCYSRHAKYFFAALATIAGLALAFGVGSM
jgi:Zn-dependent protease with chaperone function